MCWGFPFVHLNTMNMLKIASETKSKFWDWGGGGGGGEWHAPEPEISFC